MRVIVLFVVGSFVSVEYDPLIILFRNFNRKFLKIVIGQCGKPDRIQRLKDYAYLCSRAHFYRTLIINCTRD